jgi:hypothetical protein
MGNSSGKPPSATDAELAAQQALLKKWDGELRKQFETPQSFASERDRKLWEENRLNLARSLEAERGARRAQPEPARISDEQLQQVIAADQPRPRDVIDARKAQAAAPANLAEAQVALVGRCAVCGKPVTGRDVPRDESGRPRHPRCP